MYASLRKDLEQQIVYFNSLDEDMQGSLATDNQRAMQLITTIATNGTVFQNSSTNFKSRISKPGY
ncbi:MAG: hypothetical protein WKF59_01210 [Chitinophagaceae bacterium]